MAAPVPFSRPDAVAELRPRLWNYLRSSAAVHDVGAYVEALWQLPAGDFERLVAVHVALRPETADMLEAVATLMPRLPRSIARNQEEYAGFVHGPVNWERTVQRRFSSGDPTIFVCNPPERRWDTPSARMCHFALRLAARLGGMAALEPGAGVGLKVSERTDRARMLLRNPRISSFGRERYPREVAVQRAIRRYPELAKVDGFVQVARELLENPTEDSVREVLEERVLAPAADDDIFELLVGYRIVDALVANGFAERRAPALRVDDLRLPLARLKSPTLGRVDVWWDQSMWRVITHAGTPSVLRQVLDAAGMKRVPLRPDITLHFQDLDRVLVVEIKVTGQLVAAERDGIRDALAYLQDGRVVFSSQPEPQAMVVAWNATGTPWKPGKSPAPIVVSDQHHIKAGTELLLASIAPAAGPHSP